MYVTTKKTRVTNWKTKHVLSVPEFKQKVSQITMKELKINRN